MKQKIIRTTTVSLSLDVLLKGQLQFLSKHYDVVAVSGEDETLRKVENRENVRVIPIEMQRKIAPLKDLISLWNLYRCFKKEKPIIVHSITPKAGLLSMVAAYFAGVPIRMHTFTGLIFPNKTGIMQRLLITMDTILCLFATNIYPEGEGVKRDLLDYNITNKPLKILGNGNVNGIDMEHFNPTLFSKDDKLELRATLGINTNDFVFVFVGRLVGDKGMNELVEGFKVRSQKLTLNSEQLAAGVDDKSHSREGLGVCKLLLVGPFESELDPLKPETLQEIEKNPNIISVGYQEDVRPYLAISNTLVFPSYREGFPNVVLQAGAMELPSIVTDISGCNEIIEDQKNGWIIPVKNTEAIADAMQHCIDQKQNLAVMGQYASTTIAAKFNQQLVWNALLEEYARQS